MIFNLHNKCFRSAENSQNGEVSEETLFFYFQDGEMVWASYAGGHIRKGFLIGTIKGDTLQFTYQHLTTGLDSRTGKCETVIKEDEKGRLILHESWQWTCMDRSRGKSTLIECDP